MLHIRIFSAGVSAALLQRVCLAQSERDEAESVRPLPSRVRTVEGSARDRGRQIQAATGSDAAELLALRLKMYSAQGRAHWKSLALGCEHAWQAHAPTSYAELLGAVEAGGDREGLLMLGCDFEMQMAAWRDLKLFSPGAEDGVGTGGGKSSLDASKDEALRPSANPGRCTAFAATDACRTNSGSLSPLCGQNVDEEASSWDEGRRDVVVRFIHHHEVSDTLSPSLEPFAAAAYTHPGVPAYCGMNSKGLCVLNLYIDEAETGNADESTAATGDDSGGPGSTRQIYQHAPIFGVPINATIRELLTCQTLDAAVAFLENLPCRTEPTTYIIMQVNKVS